MTAPARVPRVVVFGGLGLAIFSALFSLAVWLGWWPRLLPGAFHDTDLWAGLAGGAALVALLVFRLRTAD